MNRALTRTLVACGAGLTLAVTACSGETGKATPAPTSAAATSSTGGTSAAGVLTGIEPCDLLTDAEAASLGLGAPGEPDEVGNADTCLWSQSGNGGVTAGVRPDQGFDDLDYAGDPTSPVRLGEFEGVKIESPNGGKGTCHVVIRVSDSASVQVVAQLKATSTDTAAACERATKAAELIAPKLT